MPEDKETGCTDAGGFLVFFISEERRPYCNAAEWAAKSLRKLRGGIIPFPCRKPQASAILSVVSFLRHFHGFNALCRKRGFI